MLDSVRVRLWGDSIRLVTDADGDSSFAFRRVYVAEPHGALPRCRLLPCRSLLPSALGAWPFGRFNWDGQKAKAILVLKQVDTVPSGEIVRAKHPTHFSITTGTTENPFATFVGTTQDIGPTCGCGLDDIDPETGLPFTNPFDRHHRMLAPTTMTTSTDADRPSGWDNGRDTDRPFDSGTGFDTDRPSDSGSGLCADTGGYSCNDES